MATSIATVASLEGQAWAKSADGTLRVLSVGDSVAPDEVVVTATGAHIELDFGDGHPVSIAGGEEVLMSKDIWTDLAADKQDAAVQDASVQEALTVLNSGGDLTTILEETAAGVMGGSGGDGHSFIQLTRILEHTSPEVFNVNSASAANNNVALVNDALAVNHAPSITAQIFSADEDTHLRGQIIATDIENDGLSFSVVGQPANGMITLDTTTGAFVYSPNANYNGADSFDVSVTDTHGNVTTTTISLTVNAVNDAPVSDDQMVMAVEDTVLTGHVTAADIEGDTLSFSLTTIAANGTVVVNPATGAFVYTPNANYNGSDSFVVTISDGHGGIATSTVAVGVASVNDLPVTAHQLLTTAEAVPLAGKVVATDVDGDALGYSLTTAAIHGVVTVNSTTGEFVYTPNIGYNGNDNFEITVDDGKGGTTTSTVSVAVTAVDYPAVVSTGTGSVIEDLQPTASGTLTATDLDNPSLAFFPITRLGGNGSLVLLADGSWTYSLDSRSNALAEGTASTETFVVRLTDGSTTQIIIDVHGVNDTPNTNNQNLSTAEDIPLAGNVIAKDVDGDLLSYDLTTSAAHGSVSLNATTGAFVYTPTANYNGSDRDSFVITVTDSHGATTTSTISVGVTLVDDAPVAVNDSLAAIEDTSVVYTAAQLLGNDTDIDSSSLSIASVTSGAGGTAVLNGNGTVTFTPNANFNGAADFTYTMTDGSLTSNTATVIVTVGPVNDAPVANPDSLVATEDTPVIYTAAQLLGNDTDVDLNTLSIASVTSGAGGTAVLNGDGTVTFTPSANFNGAADFTYTTTDGSLISNTATANVAVAAVNDAPIAINDSLVAIEDVPVIYTAAQLLGNDTDIDSSSLSIAGVTSGAGGTAVLNGDGTVTFTPNANFNGAADFTYTMTDGSLTSNTATVSVAVAAVNDAPVANPDSLAATEDTPVIYTAAQLLGNDTDVDLNTLSIASVTSGTGGTAVLNGDGTVTFTPNAYFNGAADFTYTTSDGSLISNTATVSVAVAAVNDAPIANPDSLVAAEDTPVIYAAAQLLGNDTDIDSSNLSIASVTSGAGGTAVLNGDGTVTFTPNANFSGTADFTYTATDGGSASNIANVNVAIAAVADAPNLSVAVDVNSGITSIPLLLPASVGLTSDNFVGIAAVDPSNANNLATVEAAVESSTPTSTATLTNLNYGSIGVDNAYHIQGYIFLEAGHTYQLAGSRDDTLAVKIGGTTVYSVGYNAWGDLYAGSDTNNFVNPIAPIPKVVTVSGYYSLEVVMYNGDGPGNLDLNLSVDGQPAVDISTANFNLYTDASTVINSGTAGAFVSNGDGGFYPLNLSTYYSYFSLNVSAALTDTDGSESLTVNAAGIPVGTTLTDGAHIFVATIGLTSADVSAWNLSELTVIPATGQTASFDVTFTATATDGASTASSVQTVTLNPADNGSAHSIGTAGNDSLLGSVHADAMFGLNGNDTLDGNGGGDLFVGGAGNDTMTGGVGADTFKWNFGDQGTVTTPAHDVLTNFNSTQGDSINLSDLLQNEAGADLTHYLHFEVSGADTTISISSSGIFNGSNYATATDQTIVLSNLNLTGGDAAIIDQLKNNGNLITD